jgi:hypothetical protein
MLTRDGSKMTGEGYRCHLRVKHEVSGIILSSSVRNLAMGKSTSSHEALAKNAAI